MVVVDRWFFRKEEWRALSDIIEDESMDLAEYYAYLNVSDLRPIRGRRWIDYILDGVDKNLVISLLGEITLREYMYIERMVRAYRWITEK